MCYFEFFPPLAVCDQFWSRKPIFTSKQFKEIRVSAKSGNSHYPLKSQEKVREFSEKSENFTEIKKSMFRTANL